MKRSFFFLLVTSALFGQYFYLINDKVHIIRILPIAVIIFISFFGVKLHLKSLQLLFFFTCYFAFTLVASLIHINVLNPNDLFNLVILYLFVVSVIVSIEADQATFFKAFNNANVLFIILSLLVWIYEIITHRHLRYSMAFDFPVDYYYQPTTAFFVNPNDFASVFVLSAMYLMSLSKRSQGIAITSWVLGFAVLAVCYTTGSRLSLVAFCIYLIVFFDLWKVKGVFVSLIFGCLVAFLILNYQLDLVGLTDFSVTASSSIQKRIDLYIYGLRSIFYSFGVGFGIRGHHYYYSEIARTEIIDPHNFFLELWIDSGVIVTLLYIMLLVVILLRLARMQSKLGLTQFVAYIILLLSSSSSVFLWPYSLFLIVYFFYSDKST